MVNGGWSIEDDSEAAGGKYLKFSGTNFDWNGRLAIRLIPSCKLKNRHELSVQNTLPR